MKKILFFSFLLLMQFWLLINGAQVIAQETATQDTSFDLTHIGVTNTAGQSFSTWTYYGENPVFKGVAPAGQEATIQIDQESFSATADEAGSWTWQPTTLTEGSYSVALSSGEASKNFTLNIQPSGTKGGETSTNSGSTSTTSAQTLPQSGSANTTLYLFFAGISMIGLGMMMTAQPAFTKNQQR
jgi:hypothetical protein